MSSPPPYRLLLIGITNTCRSLCAESVFRSKIQRANWLSDLITVSSAGIDGSRLGRSVDPDLRSLAASRGYEISGRARFVTPSDLKSADLILCMDAESMNGIRRLDPFRTYYRRTQLLGGMISREWPKPLPKPKEEPGAERNQSLEEVLRLVEIAASNFIVHCSQVMEETLNEDEMREAEAEEDATEDSARPPMHWEVPPMQIDNLSSSPSSKVPKKTNPPSSPKPSSSFFPSSSSKKKGR